MKVRAVLMIVVLAFAAGCTRSSSDTVRQLPSDLAARAYVSDIVVASVPTNVSPEFSDLLRQALRTHLARCAPGTQPLRLEVAIGLFSPQNPALTVLVGDSNKIKGTARLLDPVSGNVVGDYDIARSVGWGGIVAAAVMAPAERQMVDAFAEEVCKRAFVPAP